MGDNQIIACSNHPLCKRVWNRLRQCFWMWCPAQNNFRFCNLLVLIDSNKVCKTLQRMSCSRLKADYRFSRQLYELVDDLLTIIIRLACKICKASYTNDIAVASHHRNCLKNMLRFVTVHNHTALSLKFPRSLVDVKYNHIHTKIQSCLLSTQSCSEA